MAISDIFLIKSLVTGTMKGGISALGKDYSYWGSWRSFYGKEGFAEAGQQLHHWLLPREGAIKGAGTDWWAKNQMWNLMPMEDSKLLGLTGKEIHTLVHGKGFLKDGIRYDWNNIIGIGLKATYGTPTWFKTTINYSVSKVLNK